jgi:starch synthase
VTLRVLAVTSELFPLIKTGGLADVAGALPPALAHLGIETRTLLPAYPAVLAALPEAREIIGLPDLLGSSGRLLAAQKGELDLLLLDLPGCFDRPGNPYLGPNGRDWPDNAYRFAALARLAADIGQGLLPDWRPDVVHAHDWQAALAPAYLALSGRPRPATVVTVHNLAFQGQFDPALLPVLRLPGEAFRIDGLEYYGGIGFLKAGLFYADKLTTVSPTYAREIQTPAAGAGLYGLLRTRAHDLVGIVNGLDLTVWDPATDPHLPAPFGALDGETSLPEIELELGGKAVCKRVLQQRLGLEPEPGRLLCGVISRLTEQKGLDLVLEVVPELVARGGQLALLGSGEPGLEWGFRAAARAHPSRIACSFGYDEPLAHLIQAGCDALFVPSRFEPCGLTQLAALRYGTLPVVTRVGGLADTVIDASPAALGDGVATGFQLAPVTADALRDALARAFELWDEPLLWDRVRRRAMTRELGWDASARRYKAVYEAALAGR